VHVAFFDIVMPIGQLIRASDESFFEAIIRYLVWGKQASKTMFCVLCTFSVHVPLQMAGTIGCYFTRPASVMSDTQGATQPEGKPDRQSDDSKTTILKPSSEKLCFPAIPVALPRWPTFRQLTNTEGVQEDHVLFLYLFLMFVVHVILFLLLCAIAGVDWYSLSYADYCVRQGAMKQTADVMAKIGLNTSSFYVPGQAGPLRIAEGVDSINNVLNSANAETASRASGLLLCSITQVGGLLYFFIVLSIVSVLLVVVPFFNFVSQLVFDVLVVASAYATNPNQTNVEIHSSDNENTPFLSQSTKTTRKLGRSNKHMDPAGKHSVLNVKNEQ